MQRLYFLESQLALCVAFWVAIFELWTFLNLHCSSGKFLFSTRPIGNDVYASMKTQHEDDNNKAASQLFDQKVNPWRRNRLRRYGQRRNAHINLVCCSRAFGQPHTYRGTTLRFTK